MHVAVEGQCDWHHAVKRRVAHSLEVMHVIIVMHSHNQ